jgi:hypothetical protein
MIPMNYLPTKEHVLSWLRPQMELTKNSPRKLFCGIAKRSPSLPNGEITTDQLAEIIGAIRDAGAPGVAIIREHVLSKDDLAVLRQFLYLP